MGLGLCIDAEQLRSALKDIEEAEKRGFNYCLAVFEITSAGKMLSSIRAEYSDLWVRAHPSDRHLDWGRNSGLEHSTYRFVDGKLVTR